MIRKEITITNNSGLHARPAGEFAKAAASFRSSITVEFGSKKLNAKSIINLLSGGINCGSTICIITDGEDEQQAMSRLVELVESKFGE
ncbi:MAG: hypothetical protein APF77_07010 [Clostridia bacterium BRH_c25]|nr:MAG: hypothetical protein APF77_07010 [Clostridia bacterium BRH_c25]